MYLSTPITYIDRLLLTCQHCLCYDAVCILFIHAVLDYDHGTYQFVIQPEQQQITIPISIIDDVLLEDLREQFSVIISLLPQSGLILGNSQDSVTIVDNEGSHSKTNLICINP